MPVACFCLFWPVALASAQEQTTTLGQLLERISFDGAQSPEELGRALAELPATELAGLCDLLVEPGAGDDTRVRMALHGLTLYVGNDSASSARAGYVEALCSALAADRPGSVKVFLIEQLELLGDARAVPALARLLAQDDLCDPAVRALLAIGGRTAADALRQAYPAATGRCRVAIIGALGVLRDEQAIPLLRAELGGTEPISQDAAAAALAGIGDWTALEAYETQAPWSPPEGEPASRFAEAQRTARLLQALKAAFVQPVGLSAQEVSAAVLDHQFRKFVRYEHEQCAALHVLAEVRGAAAVPRIIDAVTGGQPALHATAQEIAVGLNAPGATEAFVACLSDAQFAGPARAAVLDILERRKDPAALPAALAALSDPDPGVRLAAARAAAALGRDQAVGPLVEFLNAARENEHPAVRGALASAPGEAVAPAIAQALAAAPPKTRATLLGALADRGARDQIDAACRELGNEDEGVRVAAAEAVAALGGPQTLEALLARLPQATGARESQALERALAAVCKRAADPLGRAMPILAALRPDDERQYCMLLRVLGQIGGRLALPAVRAATYDARPVIREAAFQSLFDWPDAAAAETMLDIARQAEELKHHVLALRAYARLVSLDPERSPQQMRSMYQTGMQTARRPEEQKLLLSKLGEIRDAATAELLTPYLSDPALHAEAAAALLNVAEGLLPAGWAEARRIVELVTASSTDPVATGDSPWRAVRERAEQVLARVAEHEDYIVDWLVTGPYVQEDQPGNELLDIAFPPEQPDAAGLAWRGQPKADGPNQHWLIDLQADAELRGEQRAAYLFTQVYLPQAQEARLELGSDDGVKVWVNNQLVHANNVLRGCSPVSYTHLTLPTIYSV